MGRKFSYRLYIRFNTYSGFGMLEIIVFLNSVIPFQFEDFANHNAFDLLEKYSSSHLVFNDDIQVACFKAFWLVHSSLFLFQVTDSALLWFNAGYSICGISRIACIPEISWGDLSWPYLLIPGCWRGTSLRETGLQPLSLDVLLP